MCKFLFEERSTVHSTDSDPFSEAKRQRRVKGVNSEAPATSEPNRFCLTNEISPVNRFTWRKVKNIIRQNKKTALLEFFFGSEKPDLDLRKEFQHFKEKIQGLQDQVNSLQQKIINLENQLQNSTTISEASQTPEKASLISEESNLSSNPNQTQNESYLKSLKDISGEQQEEIIKRGFQLQAQGKISLKKY